jgi:hypothetical protein
LENVQKINGKTLHMNFKEVADNYSKRKRKMMTDAVITNKNHQRNFPTYQATSIN